jgi:hypothetical protein
MRSGRDCAAAVTVRVVQMLLICKKYCSSWVTMKEKSIGKIKLPQHLKGYDLKEELLKKL